MAARTRPRGPPQKEDAADAHEERNMWTQIVNDLRGLKVINAKAKEIEGQILKMETEMGPSPSSAELAALENLFRENLKHSEEEQKILNEEPNDVIKNVGILTALRTASESEPPRNPANSKSRNQKRQKTEKIEMMDGAADSPGPSPIATSAAASRLKANTVRSVSVPTTKEIKEVPVKIEEGAEGGKGPSTERAGKFFVGAEVAYKQAKMKEDGSQWIQCNIINITDIGNKKRYEVQDPEPDEDGAPGQIYKTGAQALIAIPQPGTPLPDYAIGKHVLARYPNTTTFYRAEVTAMKKGSCKLKFEEDQDQEMEVDRRFVLEFSGK
ncbi:SGF29 tudor-like domain [Lasallia pustulata]|uniref:SGF29 tudor-like domain n=1 Tax=Lasallia pustulata TaxID=136370 RepID=A0A1W5D977_9LECA|nr:SGF29 tudor-like domain [Lasallia pustulata]